MAMSTVFVGNLAPEVTDIDLRSIFSDFGKIHSLRLISGRGFAFVELDTQAAGAAVDALKGTQLMGRTMDVTLEQGSGGGGRRRSKGGRRR